MKLNGEVSFSFGKITRVHVEQITSKHSEIYFEYLTIKKYYGMRLFTIQINSQMKIRNVYGNCVLWD